MSLLLKQTKTTLKTSTRLAAPLSLSRWTKTFERSIFMARARHSRDTRKQICLDDAPRRSTAANFAIATFFKQERAHTNQLRGVDWCAPVSIQAQAGFDVNILEQRQK